MRLAADDQSLYDALDDELVRQGVEPDVVNVSKLCDAVRDAERRCQPNPSR